jgi:hypothetical protein
MWKKNSDSIIDIKTISANLLAVKSSENECADSNHETQDSLDDTQTIETSEEFESENDTGVFLAQPPPAPLEAFSEEVQAMLLEAAKAFSVPVEIPIVCLLALLSGLVGQSRHIQIKKNWTEAGNLWIALAALSGAGKTPVMQAFFKELHKLECEEQRAFDRRWAQYEKALDEYKNNNSVEPPVKPKRKQIIVDDITIEALGNVHNDNPKGVLWLVDELAGMLFDQDKYSSSKGGTKTRLLSAHSRGHWKTNRSSEKARNISIPHACVSIFGGIQPNMISKVFDIKDGTDFDSGFIPRFLFIRAVSDEPATWNDFIFSDESLGLIKKITDKLWKWEATSEFMPDTIISVTDEAKDLYVRWYNNIADVAFISPNEQSMLRKLQAHTLRFCLLLHSLDTALSDDNNHIVNEDCMKRALLLTDWLRIHQEQCWRLFSPQGRQKQPDPVEYALMSVIVELATTRGDEWIITNKELFSLVRKKLGTSQIKDNILGKVAKALGIKPCRIGKKERGKYVSKENILSFRNAVSAVIPVREAMETRHSEEE